MEDAVLLGPPDLVVVIDFMHSHSLFHSVNLPGIIEGGYLLPQEISTLPTCVAACSALKSVRGWFSGKGKTTHSVVAEITSTDPMAGARTAVNSSRGSPSSWRGEREC